MRAASSERGSPEAATMRSVSRAVTIPSPELVCSAMMTWPLFSPPRPAPDTSIASTMYLSPTGVRTMRPPAPSTAAARPPLERTGTTTGPPGGAGGGQQLGCHHATRTVGAVEDDAQRGAHRGGQDHAVAAVVVEAGPGGHLAAQAGVRGAGQLLGAPEQRVELVLDHVVELQPVRVEDLEAVVLSGVV